MSVSSQANEAHLASNGNDVPTGAFAMGALQRVALSLAISLLLAAAAWWALAG